MSETPLTAMLDGFVQLTADVRLFTFRLADSTTLTFAAGQFVEIAVPNPDGVGPDTLRRAYSLCSAPGTVDEFSIVANHVPGGKGTAYLFSLTAGVGVECFGPKGHFLVDERGNRDYLFVATGTGIGPFRSMIARLLALPTSRQIRLIWGQRTQADCYFAAELDALAAEHDNFSWIQTLSRPEGAWSGAVGRVTTLVDTEVPSVAQLDVYLCGQQAMIDDVKAVLRTKGLCPVHTEKFY
jgi:CDP-4-dehydro-6-deoxyglucose reductase, E3